MKLDAFKDTLADLQQQERQLEQLPILFDTDAVAEALGQQPAHVAVDYLRYKPDTSCLARYRIEGESHTRYAYARSFGVGAADKVYSALSKAPVADMAPVQLGSHTLLYRFPVDAGLSSLTKLGAPERRRRLLLRIGLSASDFDHVLDEPLAYKPERRCVLRVHGQRASIVKLYRRADWPTAYQNARLVTGQLPDLAQRLIGRSNRHGLLRFDYIPGDNLRDVLQCANKTIDPSLLAAALARVHQTTMTGALVPQPACAISSRLAPIAQLLYRLLPEQSSRLQLMQQRLERVLQPHAPQQCYVHGDFYDKQLIVRGDRVRLLDFDQAGLGDPREDLGNYIAHHIRNTGVIDDNHCLELLGSYSAFSPFKLTNLQHYVAALLFTQLHHPFRSADPLWQTRTLDLLGYIEALLDRPEVYQL